MPRELIHRNPRTFELMPKPDWSYKLALGLDLSTSAGFAYTHFRPGRPWAPSDSQLVVGQWNLATEAYESGALRFLRLRQFLAAADPDVVFFEAIRNTPPASDFAGAGKPTIAAIASRISGVAQLFGALMATVATYCEEYDIPCAGVPIGAIKRRATGKGNAGKPEVIAACNSLLGTDFDAAGYETTGVDNIADAAFCLICGLEGHADGMTVVGSPPLGSIAGDT